MSKLLGNIDTFVFMFRTGPHRAIARANRNTVIIINAERYKAIPAWRCGAQVREVIETMVDDNTTVYAPTVFENDELRKELASTIHRLWVAHKYKFKLIDYGVESLLPPGAKRVKIDNISSEIRYREMENKYGSAIDLPFRQFEEHSQRTNGD